MGWGTLKYAQAICFFQSITFPYHPHASPPDIWQPSSSPMKPSRQSFFLLAVLTLFAGFVLTASGWKGKEAVSIAGSIGVLWFHFSAHFGERGTKWKAWPLHLMVVSFIIANLLRSFGVAMATAFFLIALVAFMAHVLTSGLALMPTEEKVEGEEGQEAKKSE
jgi:hypothetical protein